MFDAMAPFQDHHHNALIAQSGQSGCLVSSVRRRFESGLGLSPQPSGDAAIAQWQSAFLVRTRPRVQPPMVAPRLSVTTRYASGRWNRQTRYSSAHAGVIGRLRRIGQASCSWPQDVGVCGCSAVGSAAPCQGAGRGFDPRHPLQVREHPQWDADGVAVKSAPITRIGKQDLPPRIVTAEQEHRQAALDQNSPAR